MLREKHAEGENQAEAGERSAYLARCQNGIQMKVIQDNLTAASVNADLYAKNAQALTAELTQVDSWIKSQIATTIPAASHQTGDNPRRGCTLRAYGIRLKGHCRGISTEETHCRTGERAD